MAKMNSCIHLAFREWHYFIWTRKGPYPKRFAGCCPSTITCISFLAFHHTNWAMRWDETDFSPLPIPPSRPFVHNGLGTSILVLSSGRMWLKRRKLLRHNSSDTGMFSLGRQMLSSKVDDRTVLNDGWDSFQKNSLKMFKVERCLKV